MFKDANDEFIEAYEFKKSVEAPVYRNKLLSFFEAKNLALSGCRVRCLRTGHVFTSKDLEKREKHLWSLEEIESWWRLEPNVNLPKNFDEMREFFEEVKRHGVKLEELNTLELEQQLLKILTIWTKKNA